MRNSLGSLVEDVADVEAARVSAHDVGLALSAVEEPAGLSGEFRLVHNPVDVFDRWAECRSTISWTLRSKCPTSRSKKRHMRAETGTVLPRGLQQVGACISTDG